MDHVDITPSPRVLRMLGQIDFAPWQCLAELIDNSIDAFVDQSKEGAPATNPKITVSLPNESQLKDETAAIEIRDNGRGMTIEQMGLAVKAGYSGNDPVDKMGLFGMGFNISTARLGRRTEVWTTTQDSPDWTGIVIDFGDLERRSKFDVPVVKQPKTEHELDTKEHGTKIRVSLLDGDRVRALTRGGGKRKTLNRLGKIYGRVMAEKGITISYDGDRVVPRKHCVWDKKRFVETAKFGRVYAVAQINEKLPSRNFCTTCWVWLTESEDKCNACGSSNHIVSRSRSLTGWIGIQRYFHKKHYGIDLIRNGRVIEELDKSLFDFIDQDGDRETEYPIDAIHWGGRIVGELEIDFVRVTHQKDAFDKLDPEWKHVIEIVRGTSPIRPQIAKQKGMAENTSPLAKLFAGYRKANAGLKALVPGTKEGGGLNTGPIEDYLERFDAGEEKYQDDTEWYKLVELVEAVKKGGGGSGAQKATGDFPFDDPPADDVQSEEKADGPKGTTNSKSAIPAPEQLRKDEELSGPYELEDLPGRPVVLVEAYKRTSDINGAPYKVLTQTNTLRWEYNERSSFFEESLDKPVDCLLADLAQHLLTISGQSPRDYPTSQLLLKLRQKYFPQLSTSVQEVEASASALIEALRRHYSEELPSCAPIDRKLIPEAQMDHIRGAARRAIAANHDDVLQKVTEGTFVEFTTNNFVVELLKTWPRLAINGSFFVTPLEDGEDPHASQEVLELIDALADLIWLKNEGVSAINKDLGWRLRYARTVASLRLLENWRT